MDEILISPEGEIVVKALEVHRLHLEGHVCRQCLESYETTLKAIIEWVKAHGGIEGAVQQKLQEETNGSEKEKDGKERRFDKDNEGPDDQDQKPKRESWDIFG